MSKTRPLLKRIINRSILIIVTVLLGVCFMNRFTSKKALQWIVDEQQNLMNSQSNNANNQSHYKLVSSSLVSFSLQSPKCSDAVWCAVEMPSKSLFKFEPPIDKNRWQAAQIRAVNGDQVLLQRIIKVFPNYLDFLDGNVEFRKYNAPVDIFIDANRDLSPLLDVRRTVTNSNFKRRKLPGFKWEKEGHSFVIPSPYSFDTQLRSPVVKLGYTAFSTEGRSQLFEGPIVGDANMGLRMFLRYWRAVKDDITVPFIALHSNNENWGLLSTHFPNRTVDWGRRDPHSAEMRLLSEFLDHNMTLLLLVNQHSNFTHPKIVTLPRGLPIFKEHLSRTMWDTMHHLVRTNKKDSLVFTASSSWGPRPQIMRCVTQKFSESDFQRLDYKASGGMTGRVTEGQYYRRLGSSRLSLALSGLGADTFRLWEAITLGTVPVVERGMGLDKTLWRLPALLVDDFDEVTPELLRTAYVEALYRADDFEFKRLTQSFWWSFIANVSVTMDTRTVLDKFPPEAEDSGFMRPFVPFDCWKTNSCGKGTKRVPKSSC